MRLHADWRSYKPRLPRHGSKPITSDESTCQHPHMGCHEQPAPINSSAGHYRTTPGDSKAPSRDKTGADTTIRKHSVINSPRPDEADSDKGLTNETQKPLCADNKLAPFRVIWVKNIYHFSRNFDQILDILFEQKEDVFYASSMSLDIKSRLEHLKRNRHVVLPLSAHTTFVTFHDPYFHFCWIQILQSSFLRFLSDSGFPI